MISPINMYNNVSVGGIVRVRAVINNGAVSNDEKIIKSAVNQFKKILLKQKETPNADTVRQIYSKLDPDYVIPTEKLTGITSSFLTTRKSGGSRYIISGIDAENLAIAGRDIGRTNKIVEIDVGSKNIGNALGLNESAKSEYWALKGDFSLKNSSVKGRPSIILRTTSGGKGPVELQRIGFEPKSVIYEVVPPAKPPAVTTAKTPLKKGEQTDFMDKLFPKK